MGKLEDDMSMELAENDLRGINGGIILQDDSSDSNSLNKLTCIQCGCSGFTRVNASASGYSVRARCNHCGALRDYKDSSGDEQLIR